MITTFFILTSLFDTNELQCPAELLAKGAGCIFLLDNELGLDVGFIFLLMMRAWHGMHLNSGIIDRFF